ncbi:uncharacterized protein LOC136040569 [Artemia franciscana]|uniref:uncharacterized protein LOC136040569 n=1 Tax=Artemia franciscana TaxID=6661 RepID=UPI0032DBDC4F
MSRLSGLTQILTHFNMEESPIITIQCDGGDVVAKKSLLTAVSDVFKAMLESDMLEKRTNLIQANDVNFQTMKIIIDFYKEGTVSGFETLNRDAFTYIVEKYNLLSIKEEIAEYLLQSYFMKQDVKFLESVFFTYGDRFKKMVVMREMAVMIAEGKEAPKFVDNFNAPDFIELAKYSLAALKHSPFERFQCFLETLNRWLSQDSEKRSVAASEIIGIMDMQKFSRKNVISLLENIHLSKPFQGIKLALVKSLKYIDAMDWTSNKYSKYNLSNGCKIRSLNCLECSHEASYPYHVDADCEGIHLCTGAIMGKRHVCTDASGQHIIHPNKHFF